MIFVLLVFDLFLVHEPPYIYDKLIAFVHLFLMWDLSFLLELISEILNGLVFVVV